MQWCLRLEADYGMDPPGAAVFDPFVSAPNFVSVTPSMGILFPVLRRGEVSTLVFILLEFYVFCNLYLGYSKFLG